MADEDLFEYALKRVSVEAFDALLTCGVRNLAGLLRLTSEDMRSARLSRNIISELMDIPLQLKKYASEPEGENYKLCQDGSLNQTDKEKSQEPLWETGRSSHNLSIGTPIPNNLLERLPTRAKNVLNQENILTIEHLLAFQEEDLYCIRGIGRKTVRDIKLLQDKVIKSKTTTHASVNETLKAESVCEDRPRHLRRVRCLSRNAEHLLSDPADWSLLSRTLPDLYWITLPGSDFSDDEDSMTIATLDISADDLCKLREIALFPEDEADILFSVSLGYLLQVNTSDTAFSIMLDYLGRLSGNQNISEWFVATAKVADTPVFDDLKTDLIAGFRIPENLLQNLYEVLGNEKSLVYWSEIKKISERNIIKQLGFTLHGLKTIKSLWQLKEHAQILITRISAGLPASVYSSFGDLTNAFVRSIIKKEYYYPVLMGRLGFLDERKWTLEELGQRLNLTRERIRQMEKKLAPVLEKSAVIDRLSLLWYAVNESLNLGGGVCCVSEIAHSLKNLWQWHSLPADEALASLISLSPTYEIIWDNPLRVLMPNHVCVNCQVIRTFLIKAVEGRENGILDISEAVKMMKDFCQVESCKQLTDIHKFSKGFLYFLDDEIDEILADEDSLYTQFAWGVKYGMRRTALVEQIILNVGKAMHFKEVHAEVNKDRPAHGQLSDRSIYGNLERSPSLLMWGPGTFTHKDLVSIPVNLISKIGKDILSRLSTDPIPYLSITGIFENYKDLLLAEDIPNANALYSCVKIVNEQTLDCSDYPYLPLRRQIQLIEELYGEKRDLILLDNNVLASDRFKEIIQDIKALGFGKGATYSYRNSSGRTSTVNRYVDFNQGLDARLLTEEKMALLSEIAIKPARIAFDDIKFRNLYEEKIRLAAKYGLTHLSNYILYNHNDHPTEFYDRLKINLELNEELGLHIFSFPMRYVDLKCKNRLTSTPGNIGEHWNVKYLRAIQSVLIPTRGLVGTKRDYFFIAFGKDHDEFRKILLMPECYIIHRFDHEGDGSTDLWWSQVCSLSDWERDIFEKIVLNQQFKTVDHADLSPAVRKALWHYMGDQLSKS